MKRTRPVPRKIAPLRFAKVEMPEFGSAREEAEWYASHQDEIAEDFQRAAEAGELRVGVPGGPTEAVRTRPTTLRLLETDIEEARRQARRAGLRYQTYVKMVLHEGLEARRRGKAR
jgi:hypothetical protein